MKKSAVYLAIAIILSLIVHAQDQPAFFSATSTTDMEPTPSIGGLIEPDIQARQERLEEALPKEKPVEAREVLPEEAGEPIQAAGTEGQARVSYLRLLIVAIGLLVIIVIVILIIKR